MSPSLMVMTCHECQLSIKGRLMIARYVDRYIDPLSTDISVTINRVSAYMSIDYWPTCNWLLIDCRPSIGQYVVTTDTPLIRYWYLTDGSPIYCWHDPCYRDQLLTNRYVGRIATDTRLILDRHLTDVSTNILADSWPRCRPLRQWTPPIRHDLNFVDVLIVLNEII